MTKKIPRNKRVVPACEYIYAVGDRLNDAGCINEQPEWKKTYEMPFTFPEAIALVSRVDVETDVCREYHYVHILRGRGHQLHHVVMLFLDTPMSTYGNFLMPYVTVAPDMRVLIKDDHLGQITHDLIPFKELEHYEPDKLRDRVVGDASQLYLWTGNAVDPDSILYQKIKTIAHDAF